MIFCHRIIRVIAATAITVALMTTGCLPRLSCGTMARQVSLPIIVEGASNAGSLHCEIVYNTAKLHVINVKEGQLASGSLFKYDIYSPGLVVLGVANDQGLNGGGEIAVITFMVSGSDATPIPIYLENAFVYDATTLGPIIVDAIPGNIIRRGSDVQPPKLVFGQD